MKTQLNELHLFAGAGGGILGGILCGNTTVCAVEIEPYCRKVLLQRQRDGIFPRFPVWDDVRTFDGIPWRGKVDILCGGFPCTDISSARTNNRINGRQRGLDGKSSGLWFEMERIIDEIQPRFVLVENSPNLRTRGLLRILQGFSRLGYDTRRGVFGCRELGADHYRKRMFILAHSNKPQREGGSIPSGIHTEHPDFIRSDWWESEPGMERVAHGMADWSHRLKAIGNGQVPAVVKIAWETLTQ